MKQTQAKGHTAKHSQSGKHGQAPSKHTPKKAAKKPASTGHQPVHTVSGAPAQAKPRKLSAGQVACCSAEALAASLRLAGHQVAEADVLALYFNTARRPDDGASILATLRAASFGLAGHQRDVIEVAAPGTQGACAGLAIPDHRFLILGVELPGGPHALCVDPAGRAWSWGQPWPAATFADAVVEEAWVVSWS